MQMTGLLGEPLNVASASVLEEADVNARHVIREALAGTGRRRRPPMGKHPRADVDLLGDPVWGYTKPGHCFFISMRPSNVLSRFSI